MTDLGRLMAQLEGELPPLASWNPPYCGEMDMFIASDGRWFYAGSEIKRLALVKLFAGVLCVEAGEHYLKTPAEKVKIRVEDAPFLIVNWRYPEPGVMLFTDNLERHFVLGPAHPLILKEKNGQNLPYLKLAHGVEAKLGRNVYYALAEEASQRGEHFYLCSAGEEYRLA